MSRFKTELCNNLIELGNCKYGDRCHYAHGAHELRQVSRRHPKYRTEKCKNFELTGKCPFGPRCSYVHPKPDLDSMIEQLTRYMKHTKAPKPDPEDDDDSSLIQSLRVDEGASLSTCGSNSSLVKDDENKENQLLVDYQLATKDFLINQQYSDHQSLALKNGAFVQRDKYNLSSSHSSLITLTSASNFSTTTTTNTTNANVSSQASSIIRTPLGSRSTNINRRSPLQPNKQFYTRF